MPQHGVKTVKVHRPGAICPPYRCGNIAGVFGEYERELAGKTFTDPCGEKVSFFDYNFTKLVQLEIASVSSGRRLKAKAARFLEEARSGHLDESNYSWDANRAQTLFWIPDVIQQPDSIHQNRHNIIMGDRVYVKRYSKAGAPYKIVFTTIERSSQVRVVTTSFLVPEDRLMRFVQVPAIWEKKKGPPHR
jgi:hypothetical protein